MPHKFNKAKRHHIPKQKYKVTNWTAYNAALKKRGRIDIFISEELIAGWSETRIHDGHGSSQHYSQQAILACHQLRLVFHLPLRQTQGFVESVFAMMKTTLSVPAISTLCERLKKLGIRTPDFKNSNANTEDIVAIAIDSTGLKQYGRDEWHQEKHKVKSKASWRKAHFSVGDNHLIYGAKMSDKNTWDHEVVDALVTQTDVAVEQVYGDKGYDENAVYETLTQRFPAADIVIPPKDSLNGSGHYHPKRGAHIDEIALSGVLAWQKNHQYGKRNVSEIAIQRYKRTFGNRLHAREFERQEQEMMIACGVLNQFTGFGMPQSHRIA